MLPVMRSQINVDGAALLAMHWLTSTVMGITLSPHNGANDPTDEHAGFQMLQQTHGSHTTKLLGGGSKGHP